MGRGPTLELPPELAGDDDTSVQAVPLGGGFYFASFPIMGTWFELTVAARDAGSATELAQTARDELMRLDRLMSEWRADSPVSAVNRAAGAAPVRVEREVFDLVAKAVEAAERSGGAFDPTWAGMRGVWRFGDAMDGQVPSDEEIESSRALVDYRKVRLDPEADSIFLESPGMALGLGGIAKGYAIDRLASLLRRAGAKDFVVKLGGDLYAAGRHGDRPWVAGIQDPRNPSRVLASLEVEDRSFSTSGDYERFFVKDGVRYHHIIDPATGRPATASRSVTALCTDATTSEVVTKPVFILGPDRGLPYAAALGCEVVVVDASGALHVSPGLDGCCGPEAGGPGSR
ncbi:Thiamin biosynthesis lipoprotein ApbE [Vulgatibacter incomptus]|uniref:FAD:protein FMN transferase n=2 Tax=Vulgatibacter incomptus TaxID=1391653 RepID=A0A0K1P9Q4_9BACT|nr:Thiamin biosynthesis lipoprotein ApbE [Vulgatibacter incomptus]